MVDFQRKDLSGAHRHETQQDTEAPHMPINDIASPTVIAPIDRMSIEVDWARPMATNVANPSHGYKTVCFEGSDE